MSTVLRPWLVSLMSCGALVLTDSVAAVMMGEGYSATATGPAQYGWRAFTVPDFPAICEAAPDASRLEFDKTTMTLEVGDRFGLDDLPGVTATDAKGRLAQAVPLDIGRTAGHGSVDWCGQDQTWHVVATGRVDVTATGACARHQHLQDTVTIVIRAPTTPKPPLECTPDSATIPGIRPREPSPTGGSTQSDRGVADDPAGEDGVELQDREP